MRIALLSVVLFTLIAPKLSADDLFVNNVLGDDRYRGQVADRSEDGRGPTATIARALRLAAPGDRIMLANTGVPYYESVTLEGARHSGFGDRPFILQGNGATLDGTQEVPFDRWEYLGDGLFRFQPAQLHFQQLFLDGKPAARRRGATDAERIAALEGDEWCIAKQSILFKPANGKGPASYNIRFAARPVGVTLFDVHDVIVADLNVRGFYLDGISAPDGTRNCLLAGLSCRECGRSGISIDGASRAELAGCLIAGNGAGQLRIAGHCKVEGNRCQISGDDAEAPSILRTGGRLALDGKPVAAP
jgi:hypothetical protein